MTDPRHLGTLLRHLVELLDGAVEEAYVRAGLRYRPRYTPVVRALLSLGPASIRAIALHAGTTHSAASQTVAHMAREGLVRYRAGADARERIVHLAPRAQRMLPALERQWAVIDTAARRLDQELSVPLSAVVGEAIAALGRESFGQRIERAAARRPRLATIGAILLLAAAPGIAAAQGTAPAEAEPPRLTQAAGTRAVTGITGNIRESYVFPEKRGRIVERLERSRRAGRYGVEDPGVFAERMTEDLRAASADGHLYLRYDPAQYAVALRAESGGSAEDGDLAAYWRRRGLREYHGLAEMRVLPGNLRYLRIGAFYWVRDETGTAYDAAMRFLKEGDAVILDLRGNGGGSHAAVQYLVSHFLEGDKLEMTFLQAGEPPSQSRTLEHLPAGRLTGKPLYVLIDGGVASAGEAFAYDVRQFKLGELVGARTAGGANNNRLVPIAPYFMLSVSTGRPVHPVSGTNWEGTGVEPTVPAAPEIALEVAESLALGRLAKTRGASAERLAEYAWASIGVEARLRPVSVGPERLKAYAGGYGEVEITWREGSLWLVRRDRPTRRLRALTADGMFAVEGSEVLRVRFTTRGLETLYRGDPLPRRYDRD